MVFNIYQKFSKMFRQSNNVNKKREELSKFLRWVRRSWLTQNGWECEHFQILRLRSRCTLAYSDHHGNRWLPRRAWCETRRGDQTLPEHVRSFLFSSYFYSISLLYTNLPRRGIWDCFLSKERKWRRGNETMNFFETPTFIYFQLYVVIIHILNIVFMTFTVKTIHETFKNRKQLMCVNIVVFLLIFEVSINSSPCYQTDIFW